MASSVSSSRWMTSPPQTSQVQLISGRRRQRVVGPAVDADPAGGQPAQDLAGVDLDVDGQVEVERGQDVGQPLGLGHRAGAPVEDEAPGPDVALAQPLGHHVHDQVVAQQLAPVHLVLGLLPDGRALLDRGAQHVPGRDMGHHVVVGEAHTLRPLACPLFAEDNEPGSGYHLLEEALVVSHHELAVDLLHRLECHAHGDQESGAVEGIAGDVPGRHQQRRGDGHRRRGTGRPAR